jgi:hypothetical protein
MGSPEASAETLLKAELPVPLPEIDRPCGQVNWQGERLHGMHFATRRQAKDEVIDWLQFYNHRRLHSTPEYLSPMAISMTQCKPFSTAQ